MKLKTPIAQDRHDSLCEGLGLLNWETKHGFGGQIWARRERWLLCGEGMVMRELALVGGLL